MNCVISSAEKRITYGQAIRRFSKNAKLYLSLSTVVGAFLGAVLPSLFLIFVTAQGVDMLGALGFGGERAAALRLTLMMSVPFGIVELLPLTRMKESFVQSPTPLREIFLLKHVKNRITVGKLFLVSLLYAAGLGVYFPLLNLHFEASFHIHEAEFGSITAFNNIAILASMLAVPLVVLRLGKIRTIVASRFLAAPFLVALSFSPTLFLASLFFVMRGALATMAMPIASAYSMEVVNESERATTAGFTHMAFDLAYGALIFAGGLLFALGGFWAAFVVGGVLYLSHATLWWVFFRNHRVEKRTVF